MIVIDLPPQIEQTIHQQAQAQGISAKNLVEKHYHKPLQLLNTVKKQRLTMILMKFNQPLIAVLLKYQKACLKI